MYTAEFTTYYTISFSQCRGFVLLLLTTISFCAAMATGVILVRKKRTIKNILFLSVSLIAVIISFVFFLHNYSITKESINNYLDKNYEILEGKVIVEHLQPKTGHAPGDKLLIDGREIEINYFSTTPGYHKTVAHGGVLREGVYARIFINKNTILRVDIK